MTDSNNNNRNTDTNAIVIEHYNQRPRRSFDERNQSPILHLRNFNNWIKAILIQKYCRKGYFVLDYAGGKGGDLRKWVKACIGYLVLIDIAEESVKDAMERYNRLKVQPFPVTFISADCCKDLRSHFDRLNVKFDLVSCQFALHYSFETEEKARNFIRNVSHVLKPGGYFIGTIPNANLIVKRLRNSESLSFGNELYTISFQSKDFPKFGARYNFFLIDAVENVPEYLVHFPTLVSLCKEYEMELEYEKRFHEFYVEHKTRENVKLMDIMKVFDESGSMPQKEWDIARTFRFFDFFNSESGE